MVRLAMSHARLALVALGILHAAASSAGAAEVPQSLLPLLLAKEEYGRDLAEPIAACVVRRDTDHPVFHGCIDWHSSVHGHWALIALNRAAPDIALPEKVRSVFANPGIGSEIAKLEGDPDFEMPYGRAWFLRLAIEYMRANDDMRTKQYADRVLHSLVRHFEARSIDLLSVNYASATWALVNMLDYANRFGMTSERIRIVAQIENKVDFWTLDCSYDEEVGLFMALCTNVALLAARVLEPEDYRRWSNWYLEHVGLPEPVGSPVNPHHHGLNFSRSWGLWELYSATGRLEFADAYAAHFLQTFQKPEHWRGDYEKVGHWVAQFGVFALQPLFGHTAGR